MMIIVNFQGSKTQDSKDQARSGVISGSVNGTPFGVSFDEEKYRKMKELEAKANSVETMDELKQIVEEFLPLTQESYKEIAETKSPFIVVNKHTNKFYLRYNDVVSSQPLPQVFVDKIIKSIDKGIDIEPLIKCWARYMRPVKGRPAYNMQSAALFAQYIDADYVNPDIVAKFQKDGLASDVATAYGTTKQVAITQEGLLVCYKVSTEVEHRYELDSETEEVKSKSRYGKTVDPDTGKVELIKPEFVEERLFEPAVMGQRGDEFFCSPTYEKPGHKIKVGNVHYLDSWDKVSSPGHKGLHVGKLKLPTLN